MCDAAANAATSAALEHPDDAGASSFGMQFFAALFDVNTNPVVHFKRLIREKKVSKKASGVAEAFERSIAAATRAPNLDSKRLRGAYPRRSD
ncbi:MAG TPA: hypothetical protein VJP85_14610 [Candidatus Baltobacteraceae bacterium]|nr:hypothetical protein [Candidatus Baltobacteraceae bacterium]